MKKSTRKAAVKKVEFKDPITFSVYKTSEGGPGQTHSMFLLKEAKIPVRRGYSPYVGQVGIEVPSTFARRAELILFGGRQ